VIAFLGDVQELHSDRGWEGIRIAKRTPWKVQYNIFGWPIWNLTWILEHWAPWVLESVPSYSAQAETPAVSKVKLGFTGQ